MDGMNWARSLACTNCSNATSKSAGPHHAHRHSVLPRPRRRGILYPAQRQSVASGLPQGWWTPGKGSGGRDEQIGGDTDAVSARSLTREQLAFAKLLGQILARKRKKRNRIKRRISTPRGATAMTDAQNESRQPLRATASSESGEDRTRTPARILGKNGGCLPRRRKMRRTSRRFRPSRPRFAGGGCRVANAARGDPGRHPGDGSGCQRRGRAVANYRAFLGLDELQRLQARRGA